MQIESFIIMASNKEIFGSQQTAKVWHVAARTKIHTATRASKIGLMLLDKHHPDQTAVHHYFSSQHTYSYRGLDALLHHLHLPHSAPEWAGHADCQTP